MSRPLKLIAVCLSAVAVAVAASACGESISVPNGPASSSSGQIHQGAVLFSQRCAGCHTLSYAGTHGSAANVRTAQFNNGPNFDVRCERPVARVLYAIANGGFSGAIMPQNIVVGQDAIDVAKFVSTYSGRHEPKVPGVPPCNSSANPVGSVPTPAQLAAATKSSGGATQQSAATGSKKTKGQPGGPASNQSSTTSRKGGKKTTPHP